MFYLLLKRVLASFLLAALALGFIGCTAKKGVVKDSQHLSARDAEKKARALQLFKEGAELFASDLSSANKKFDQALELDPKLLPAYFNAGLALLSQAKLEEAALRFEQCLEENRESSPCLLSLLLVKSKQNDLLGGDALVESYGRDYPDSPLALVAASRWAMFKHDWLKAEELAREVLERDAENVDALAVMARVFFERQQYPAAKWVIKNALELAPSHGELYLLLGHTESKLGLLHDALDAYALAVKYQPEQEALESYGLLLLKRGRVKEALAIFQRLAVLAPNEFRNQLHLGNAWVAKRSFEQAKSAYARALALKPDDKDINFNLGILYFDLAPKELVEIERLKLAQGYFKAYLEQPALSQERMREVQEYLTILEQKIEVEEYKAESEKEFLEEPEESEEESPKMEEPLELDEEPKNPSSHEEQEQQPHKKKKEPNSLEEELMRDL